MSAYEKWLLLLYRLPTKHGGARVSLWRQLKKMGALPFKTSASLLPDSPDHFERFHWLAQQVRDAGGEATLIRVTEIEGLSHSELVGQFNDARAHDYDELASEVAKWTAANQRKGSESHHAGLETCIRHFDEIQKVDFFGCPRAQELKVLIQRATSPGVGPVTRRAKLSPKKYVGSTWLTRPRPQVDRVGSAWLIRRFIDPRAVFVFADDPKHHPDAIPYDMFEAEFSHQGEDCTFETFVRRFAIADQSVLKMAEIIHDADLEDGKFQTTEGFGITRVLKGWAKMGLTDEELLSRGAECFEALYQSLKV